MALASTGYRPDWVSFDMHIPGMDGAETLPRQRALLPRVPVLTATGRADQSAMHLVDAHDRITLLPKPLSLQEMRRKVAVLARQSATECNPRPACCHGRIRASLWSQNDSPQAPQTHSRHCVYSHFLCAKVMHVSCRGSQHRI